MDSHALVPEVDEPMTLKEPWANEAPILFGGSAFLLLTANWPDQARGSPRTNGTEFRTLPRDLDILPPEERAQRMSASPVPVDRVEQTIIFLRGQRVILDRDLAALYEVPMKALKQAVKRNIGRFPEDFMFVLTPQELTEWRSQFVTSMGDRMGLRHPPMAFTEQGVAMLSSVLSSERAILVNIEIIRAFVQIRRILGSNAELARRLDALEKKYDAQFKVVFDAIRQLMAPPTEPRRSIGFRVEEARPQYLVRWPGRRARVWVRRTNAAESDGGGNGSRWARLNERVRRNPDRFPSDFMFSLS
jgi:hypothetical protein